MLFTGVGFVGYALITLALLMRALGWISGTFLFAAIIVAGFFCFGIVENRLGIRHRMVRYVDYAPLMVLVIAYVLYEDNTVRYTTTALLLPLSLLSSWIAVAMAKTKRYRTRPKIDEQQGPPKYQ